MTDPTEETRRYLAAAREIIANRDPERDRAAIMVTLEGAVATVLTIVMGGDHRLAAGMLNEGLVQGVEERLALGAERRKQKHGGKR